MTAGGELRPALKIQYSYAPTYTLLPGLRQGSRRALLLSCNQSIWQRGAWHVLRARKVDGVQTAVEFDDVTYAYAGAASPALDHVSFSLREGEFVCIIGSNGSGKSTLARHMNALLVPDAGTVRVFGHDTSAAGAPYQVRPRVGMVFQDPDSQSVAPLVADDVAFGPENLGLSPEQVRGRVQEALDGLGISQLTQAEVASLSGGQKQLVAFAGVMAMHPDVYVLDEPGAMLDARSRAVVMDVARRLHGEGRTVVLVTHFMQDALLADRVLALDRGRLAYDGAPKELLSQADAVRAIGLEPPFEVCLAEALAMRGLHVPDPLDSCAWKEGLCPSRSSR